jgi:chromosome segregation ATPase
LTYTSQELKKTETYEEHIEEQITVSEVVIKSKKEDVTEQKEKVSIIET